MINKSDEKFFEQLSKAGFDEAEQIERDMQEACKEGWSEETAWAFIHGVMLLRKKMTVLVPNALDLALREGIRSVVATVYETKPKKRTLNVKSKLSGKGI